MRSKQRARSADQKQQRRQTIIDAAWELYGATGYDTITIAQVAEHVGVAKGTIYLYFATKEELFLAIQEQQLTAWFAKLDSALRIASRPLSAAAVATLISESVIAQPDFTRLLAILHPIIEQNIGYERAKAFKLLLRDHLAATGALIEAHIGAFSPGGGARLLLWAYALVIGFKHLSDQVPALAALAAEPELAALQVDFAPSFTAALQAMVHGMID